LASYFYAMTAKEELRKRHQKAIATLNKVAVPIIEKYGLNKSCTDIGRILGVSYQTVVNYVYGRVKDGYLCEAIIKEFKKIK